FKLSRFRLSLEAYLEAARVSEEPDWEIYNSIAECYMHLRDANSAKEYARKAIQYGKQEESYSLLTKIFDLEGDVRSAIAVCIAAIGSCPDNIEMMTQLGMFYLRQRETQMAFEKFTTALEVEPECTKALLGVGCITQAHGEYDVALSKYKIALQHNPESVALWNNVGLCFYSKQKYVAAVTCLKRALWISPLNWKVLFNLGLVHLATQQAASAFNFLCASINIRPDVSFCFTALGYVLLELQDSQNALRAFAQAEMISPGKPAVMVNLCICLYLMGRHRDASNKVQEVLALKTEDSNDKEAFDLALKLSSVLEENRTSNEVMETSKLPADIKSKDTNNTCRNKVQHDLKPDEV
ncbi:Bardet-Biedl syndrome 4 protein homolog, partial [Agrilus planipennis]|uniref:Bardet-Biedl syndrome 4 protein homolog n=1 Tax=Agrilus planipennis TaxID=224129 RepID=A0A1W4XMP3_AGRPL